ARQFSEACGWGARYSIQSPIMIVVPPCFPGRSGRARYRPVASTVLGRGSLFQPRRRDVPTDPTPADLCWLHRCRRADRLRLRPMVSRVIHKFTIGEAVEFRPGLSTSAARGVYIVIKQLLENDGEPKYRVRRFF